MISPTPGDSTCPFCGSPAMVDEQIGDDRVYLCCANAKCAMHNLYVPRETWNQRHTPSERRRNVPADLWDEIVEFIEDHVDVRDGEDGPRPNTAMHLSQQIKEAGL